ncbi:MAG: phosphoglycerate kinase [Rhodocyclaceae bacterium]|nr:phosphoglycerate kinase [Rhodocyclaceae bacterium]
MSAPFLRLNEVELAGRRVFLRADFNVPLSDDGGVADDSRIRATLPGIRDCLARGASLAIASHLGRPTAGRLGPHESLAPVARRLSELLGRPVPLVKEWRSRDFAPPFGEVVMLENCRGNAGETADDPLLAERLARYVDVYVNDAFGTAHRKECTLSALAKAAPMACAGPLLAAELDALGRALAAPRRPLAAIVGGSKVSTKLAVLERLAEQVDLLIVGGGIANTFIAAQGHDVGASLFEAELLASARRISERLAQRGARLWLPTDVVCADHFGADAEIRVCTLDQVPSGWMILDVGPDSQAALTPALADCGTVVWNGPLGVFELDPFAAGTRALAAAIAASPAFSIAGGGDTLAAIARFDVADGLDMISTGGGAFLEFLEGRTLPAIAALLEARRNAAGATV